MIRKSLRVFGLTLLLLATQVVVVGAQEPEPEPEEDPIGEEACHPAAQWIADALNALDPGLREQDYACEDVFDFFQGAYSGAQLGFGRMRQAYRLTLEMGELTWETVLNWHIDGNGWGSLKQLKGFSELLEDWTVEDLMALLDGETSLTQIRHAVQMVTRYGADFDSALELLSTEGISPGQAKQIFRVADELGLESEQLAEFLAQEASPAEIRQAARLAGGDLEKLAEILSVGIHEYREAQRNAAKAERRGQGEEQSEQDPEAAASEAAESDREVGQLARQLGLDEETVRAVFEGECAGDRSCTRKHFRDQQDDQQGGGQGKGKGKNK